MNVVLVAQDIAPSNAFQLLETELVKRGHSAKVLIGKGKVFPVSLDVLREIIGVADVVVVGMSSSAKFAEPEIAACEAAVLHEKLFGFYGDTYHCHERAATGSWFGPYNQLADFFLAINEEEAQAARKVLTDVTAELSVATGNPTWEDYVFPKFTRAQVREKLNVAEDEVFILAPGWKLSASNIVVWELLIEALRNFHQNLRIIFSCHPGDRLPFAVDSEVVEKIVTEKIAKLAGLSYSGNQCLEIKIGDVIAAVKDALSDKSAALNIYSDLKTFSSIPVEFLPRDVKTSDVLPGADLVVEWGSSIAIEAAHQRIPVISVSTEIGRKRMLSISKTENWEPVELGVALEVGTNPIELKDKIVNLLGNREHLRYDLQKRQAEVYPKPQEKGTAVRKMADTLEKLVK